MSEADMKKGLPLADYAVRDIRNLIIDLLKGTGQFKDVKVGIDRNYIKIIHFDGAITHIRMGMIQYELTYAEIVAGINPEDAIIEE
jgi:hypothetical protein